MRPTVYLLFLNTGRWGSEAEDFLQRLAKQSSSISGSRNISNFKNFCLKHLNGRPTYSRGVPTDALAPTRLLVTPCFL